MVRGVIVGVGEWAGSGVGLAVGVFVGDGVLDGVEVAVGVGVGVTGPASITNLNPLYTSFAGPRGHAFRWEERNSRGLLFQYPPLTTR